MKKEVHLVPLVAAGANPKSRPLSAENGLFSCEVKLIKMLIHKKFRV
jgi:hypothetical protein